MRVYALRAGTLLLILLVIVTGPLHRSFADGCDPLADVEVGYPPTTDWQWVTDACPPPPSAGPSPTFNGVGVTLYGGVTAPTLNNLFGMTVPAVPLRINSLVRDGYEGGLLINSWVNQDIGFRLTLGVADFPRQVGGMSFQLGQLTLGTVLKLVGSQTVFLYLAADGGGALSGLQVSNALSGTSPSPFLDVGIGLNVLFFEVEVDYAALFSPGGLPGGTAPFFYVPFTLGIHL